MFSGALNTSQARYSLNSTTQYCGPRHTGAKNSEQTFLCCSQILLPHVHQPVLKININSKLIHTDSSDTRGSLEVWDSGQSTIDRHMEYINQSEKSWITIESRIKSKRDKQNKYEDNDKLKFNDNQRRSRSSGKAISYIWANLNTTLLSEACWVKIFQWLPSSTELLIIQWQLGAIYTCARPYID